MAVPVVGGGDGCSDAQDRTGRVLDDPNGVGAQPAKRLSHGAPADEDDVRARAARFVDDGLRHLADDDMERGAEARGRRHLGRRGSRFVAHVVLQSALVVE